MRDYTAYFVVEFCYDGQTRTEAGFYPANTFTEAVGYLEAFYGEDLMTIKHLEIMDGMMITMKPEVAKSILEELYS